MLNDTHASFMQSRGDGKSVLNQVDNLEKMPQIKRKLRNGTSE
jgi:hypothetical protein